MRARTIRLILATITLLANSHAQNSSGRISGGVFDSSQAIVAAAKVTATNVDTGIVLSVVTNHDGEYVLYPLPPGTYKLSVTAPGFRTEQIDGVRVDVAALLQRDVHLQV